LRRAASSASTTSQRPPHKRHRTEAGSRIRNRPQFGQDIRGLDDNLRLAPRRLAIAKSKSRKTPGPQRHEVALTHLEGLLESLPAGTGTRALAILIGKLGEDPRCTNAVETACLDFAEILADLPRAPAPQTAEVWRRIDQYQPRRIALGRHSNVSRRFIAERDREERRKIAAAVRIVLRKMPQHSDGFDPEHWAKCLVKEVRCRMNPTPRPLGYTEVIEVEGRKRLRGGDEWWNVAVANRMLFGDKRAPRGKVDARSVANATRWLFAQLYGHESSIGLGSWTSYVKNGRRELRKG
jgi:hypothetical protein